MDELRRASTAHRDYTGTASFDLSMMKDRPGWAHVDGYVTWGMEVGFIHGLGDHLVEVVLLLYPVGKDHDAQEILERGEVHLSAKTLGPMTFNDFAGVFSQSDIVVLSKAIPEGATVTISSHVDDLE